MRFTTNLNKRTSQYLNVKIINLIQVFQISTSNAEASRAVKYRDDLFIDNTRRFSGFYSRSNFAYLDWQEKVS